MDGTISEYADMQAVWDRLAAEWDDNERCCKVLHDVMRHEYGSMFDYFSYVQKPSIFGVSPE